MNRNFIAWLERGTPNLETQCKKLKRSRASVLKEARKGFEKEKRNFTGEPGWHGVVTILPILDALDAQGAVNAQDTVDTDGADLPPWVIILTSGVMKSFFDPVIADIKSCIDTQVTKKTKILLVPGGFGKSG